MKAGHHKTFLPITKSQRLHRHWSKLVKDTLLEHTVITPVAALTPASPKIAVAASVTSAVAPILTTLRTTPKWT